MNKLTYYLKQAFNALLEEMEGSDEDEVVVESINVLMMPEHDNALFWSDAGKCVGGLKTISPRDDIRIDLSDVDGLQEWYYEWEDEIYYHTNHWNNQQWKDWWNRGLQIAREVRKVLPREVKLYYFSVNDRVWVVRPEDTIGGGVFDLGVAMRVV